MRSRKYRVAEIEENSHCNKDISVSVPRSCTANKKGNKIYNNNRAKAAFLQGPEQHSAHAPVCFASGLPWIPCPLSTVDPFLHKASPAPTPPTARRITWLWWVPVAAGGSWGRTHCVLFVLMIGSFVRCTYWECSSCLPPLAEPSVYLPSRKWHQQPSPEDMRQRGLPCAGLSAGFAQPTQKSK